MTLIQTTGPEEEPGWWVVVCDTCHREARGRADDQQTAGLAAQTEGFEMAIADTCPDCVEILEAGR